MGCPHSELKVLWVHDKGRKTFHDLLYSNVVFYCNVGSTVTCVPTVTFYHGNLPSYSLSGDEIGKCVDN